jgi:hypothetical protein
LEKCRSVLGVLARFTDSDLVTLRESDSENSSLNLITCYFDQLDGEEFQVPQSVTRSLSTKAVKDSVGYQVIGTLGFNRASGSFSQKDLANDRTRSFLNPLANLVFEKPISIYNLEQVLGTVAEMELPRS